MYVESNTEAPSRNTVTVEKQQVLIIGLCACACMRVGARAHGHEHACARVVLLIQHAKRVRHIVSSSVAFLTAPHFSTLSHKRRDFWKSF